MCFSSTQVFVVGVENPQTEIATKWYAFGSLDCVNQTLFGNVLFLFVRRKNFWWLKNSLNVSKSIAFSSTSSKMNFDWIDRSISKSDCVKHLVRGSKEWRQQCYIVLSPIFWHNFSSLLFLSLSRSLIPSLSTREKSLSQLLHIPCSNPKWLSVQRVSSYTLKFVSNSMRFKNIEFVWNSAID